MINYRKISSGPQYILVLEKEMATHSSVLAWRIPGMERPGGLQSMGLQSRTRLSTYIIIIKIRSRKLRLNIT